MNRINGGATTSGRNHTSPFPTEDELIVAQILLDLKPMMSLIDSLADSNWKRKRRRSCLDQIPPLPSLRTSQNQIKAVLATEKDGGENRTAVSPDSPFLFAQSDESGEKSKHSSRKTSAKRSKKNHLDLIQQLTQQRHSLQGEINNVKKYCTNLMAYNSQLKKIRQQASGGTNVGIALIHRQPLIAHPTAQEIQYPIGPITAHSQPFNHGLGSFNRVGLIGFDLNAPAEETLAFLVEKPQPLDVDIVNAYERARCAEARRMRKGIMKMKSIKRGVLKML